MTIEKIIVTIRNELIRSVSGLDEWFDKDGALMDHRSPSGNRSVRELLECVMLTNRTFLDFIDKGYPKTLYTQRGDVHEILHTYCLDEEVLDQAVNNSYPEYLRNVMPAANISLPLVRREIREQLDRCLIYLELLHHGEGVLYKTGMTVDRVGQLDIYQALYFLALHVKCHLLELQKMTEDNTESVGNF